MPEVKRTLVGPAYALPLTVEQLAKVGQVILVWNQIEFLMETVVTIALDLGLPAGETIMGSPNVRPRAEILAEVVAAKFPGTDVSKQATKCGKRIAELSNFRNDVAHGRWTFSESGPPESRKKLLSSKPITMAIVESKLDELCKLSVALAKLMFDILRIVQPEAVPGKLPWDAASDVL